MCFPDHYNLYLFNPVLIAITPIYSHKLCPLPRVAPNHCLRWTSLVRPTINTISLGRFSHSFSPLLLPSICSVINKNLFSHYVFQEFSFCFIFIKTYTLLTCPFYDTLSISFYRKTLLPEPLFHLWKDSSIHYYV